MTEFVYNELLGIGQVDLMQEIPFSCEFIRVEPLQAPLGAIYHVSFRYANRDIENNDQTGL